jgi:hypothetical protein
VATPVPELYSRELAAFNKADGTSNFFNSKWHVQWRCIERYSKKADEALAKASSDDDKKFNLKAKHTFQMIMSVQKFTSTYRAGPSDEKSLEEWMKSWGNLETFLEDKDGVSMECKYVWSTHYDVLCELPVFDKFPSELGKFTLLKRSLISSPEEAHAFQRRCDSLE